MAFGEYRPSIVHIVDWGSLPHDPPYRDTTLGPMPPIVVYPSVPVSEPMKLPDLTVPQVKFHAWEDKPIEERLPLDEMRC